MLPWFADLVARFSSPSKVLPLFTADLFSWFGWSRECILTETDHPFFDKATFFL